MVMIPFASTNAVGASNTFKYHCLSYLLIMASCLTGRE